jgi:hypothetical protein
MAAGAARFLRWSARHRLRPHQIAFCRTIRPTSCGSDVARQPCRPASSAAGPTASDDASDSSSSGASPTRSGTVVEGTPIHLVGRSASLIDPGSRSGLSDIAMHPVGEQGTLGRWDLSHQLQLFDFGPDGAYAERMLPLSTILQDLGLTASTSFLRKVRATQIQKVTCEGNTIFITLGDLRAFIAADRVLLFGTQRPLVREHARELEHALSETAALSDGPAAAASGLPYEMRALETMLAAVTDMHEARLGAETFFLRRCHSILKPDYLPRQARDKRREALTKEAFADAGVLSPVRKRFFGAI